MSKSKKFNRVLKMTSWSFLTVIFLIIQLVSILLTSAGTRRAIDYVNESDFGLTVSYKGGSLYSQLDLQQVLVAQKGLDVRIDHLSLDIGLSCLFRREVCINGLAIEKVAIVIGDMPETAEKIETVKNELIKLPVLVSLDEFNIAQVSIKQHDFEMLKAEDISISLSFLEHLDITNLGLGSLAFNLPKTIEADESEVLVSKNLRDLPRPWLRALANFKYEPIGIPVVFIPINLTLKNANLSNICIRQQRQDDSLEAILCNDNIAAAVTINNQKLATTLVLSNVYQAITAPNFVPSNLKLNASINFAKQFEHNLSLRAFKIDTPVAASEKSKPLKIDTPIFDDTKGFKLESQGRINKMSLSLMHLLRQQKLLSVAVNMELEKPQLPLTLDLSFEQLSPTAIADIQSWFPELKGETLEQLTGVSLLSANVSGDMQGYRVIAMAKTASISGIEELELNALLKLYSVKQGPYSLIAIDKLNVSGDIGSIEYTGKALLESISNDQTQLSWQGSLAMDSLQIAQLNKSLDSMISGVMPHEFEITEKTQSGRIKGAQLSGTWQNLPLLLKADAELEKSGNVKVQTVSLNQGDNEILVKGNLHSRQAIESLSQLGANFTNGKNVALDSSSLSFTIDLNSLNELYPGLQGQINAQGTISGAIGSPKLLMQASVNKLGAAETKLENALIELSIDMANKLTSTATISVTDLFAGGQLIPQLNLGLSGDGSEHSLLLTIPEGEYVTKQLFKGKLNADSTSWSGQWLEGKIVTDLIELHLQEQPKLELSLKPFRLFLGKHCWDGRGDKLCLNDVNATQQTASTRLSMDYNVMNPGMVDLLPNIDVAASVLELALDADVNWQEQIGVSFSADITSQNSNLLVKDKSVSIESIVAKIEGTPSNIKSSFTFDSAEAGQVGINSQLELASKPYQHQGSLRISEFAMSYFAPFITIVERLNGDINANVTFEGPLDKPSLQGELTLADGAFVLKEYPLKLTDYNQKVAFEGSKADFSGSFVLGDGEGTLDGDIDFANELIVNAKLVGEKLAIAYETYQFKISPDMQLSLRPELLQVTGKVEVPFARVKIKSLPPSAKSPSQDIVVIDEQLEAKQSQIPLDVRLNVVIDKDKKGEVKLDALDLYAELSGDLDVKIDASNTTVHGSVQILKGDYEAYSQVLQIRTGDITFSGQSDVPAFDIEAIRNPLHTKDNVIAGIRVSGNALKPAVVLFSEPSMEQAQQLSYLISGADSFGAGGESDSNTTLVNALVSFGVGRSENGIGSLGRKLGVKDLNLQTAGQGSDTQVQLSGQLAEGVKVTYGIGVFDSVSEVSVHYQLLPQLYLEAVSGANNTLDLYYQITSKD